MATNSSYGRRDFLKDSVFSTVRAAHELVKQADGLPAEPLPPPVRVDWLRPPGAVAEHLFLERCTKCNDCVVACPPGAIVAHPQDGTPVVFADQSPCLLCEDLPCITACRVDALVPVEGMGQVHMGIAGVSHRLCTAVQGFQVGWRVYPLVVEVGVGEPHLGHFGARREGRNIRRVVQLVRVIIGH